MQQKCKMKDATKVKNEQSQDGTKVKNEQIQDHIFLVFR